MASNTNTVWTDTDTGIVDEDISPPRRLPPTRLLSRGRRALPWAALAAAAVTTAVLAVSAFAGDHDAGQPAIRAALQHEAERYVESLESRAASIPGANRAALEHQAEQYVEWLQSRAASISGGGSSTDGFVPGNLPALEHQAEQYVEWLQSRAASISDGGS
jgi:hypothetical protein